MVTPGHSTPFCSSTPLHQSPATPNLPLHPLCNDNLPAGSLLPNKLPLLPVLNNLENTPRMYVETAESLTREKKGKMPALSHLLSVGKGRVLALAADEKYVYAGCQSADNEIVVSPMSPFAPTEPSTSRIWVRGVWRNKGCEMDGIALGWWGMRERARRGRLTR